MRTKEDRGRERGFSCKRTYFLVKFLLREERAFKRSLYHHLRLLNIVKYRGH